MKFKPLNTREIKSLLSKIKEEYQIKDLKLDYIFFENQKGKIHIISKDYQNLDTNKLRINKLGLYFATREKDGIRLSLEGSQLLGSKSKKIYNASKEQIDSWVKGNDLETKEELRGYLIIKYNNNFYGIGKFSKGRILNFISKSRRIKSDIKNTQQ